MFDLSPIQILIALVIALLAFGPRRLPELGRSIGRTLRDVRGAMNPLGADPPTPPSPGPRSGSAREAAPPPAAPVGGVEEDRADDLAGMIVPGDTLPSTASPDAEPGAPAKVGE